MTKGLTVLARAFLVGCLLFCGAAASTPLEALEIQLDESFPQEGTETGVVVTDAGVPLAGVEVIVHYNPNSATTREETLPLTDEAGRTSWVPQMPSVVRLDASRSTPGNDDPMVGNLTASVGFERFPIPGIAIMTLAALLLFGGAFFGLIRLMRQPAASQLPEPPST